MDWVVEVADVDSPDSDTDECDNLGQLLAELVQLGLQRSLLLLGGGHLVTDLADLGGDAGGCNYANGLASSDVGALQQQLEADERRQVQQRQTGDELDSRRTLTEKSMFFLSWLTALRSGTASVCLITLTDSPEEQKKQKIYQTPQRWNNKNTTKVFFRRPYQ